jgi:hypothetical protein
MMDESGKLANKIGIVAQPNSNVRVDKMFVGVGEIPQIEGNPFKPPQPREGGLFGREKDLERLHELLRSGKNVCLVSGMGGVGKTELVRHYAASEECKAHFSGGVFYIDVRSRENIVADIVALTKYHFHGDIQDDLSPQQKVNACWDTWKRQTEKALLILDDVSGLAKNVKQYLPPSDLVTLRLLMTSRDTPDQRIAAELPLEVLLPDAALELSLFREKTSTSRGRMGLINAWGNPRQQPLMNHGQGLAGGGESWF